MAVGIITHATDTLKESAIFLEAKINCGKPFIAGAAQSTTTIPADGPLKLLDVTIVGSGSVSRNLTAIVVLKNLIAAYNVETLETNTLDTFKAREMGDILAR
jgi:L-asparaginase/Glu-tRNA(Gln) amidotransferase subunit D